MPGMSLIQWQLSNLDTSVTLPKSQNMRKYKRIMVDRKKEKTKETSSNLSPLAASFISQFKRLISPAFWKLILSFPWVLLRVFNRSWIMRLNIKLQWTETHTGQGLAIFFHLSWTTSDLLLQKLDTLSFLKTKHLPIWSKKIRERKVGENLDKDLEHLTWFSLICAFSIFKDLCLTLWTSNTH